MSELKRLNLRDTALEECEFCGMCHLKTLQIEGYGDFKCRTQCESCCEAEKRLSKISDLLTKTLLALRETPNNAKNSETRAKLDLKLEVLKNKQAQLIEETREILQGRTNQKECAATSRLPYKEN